MADRAGFTVTAFILDVSKSMGRMVPDPTYDEDSGKMVQKLALAKEYVTRKLVTLIQAQRKTEHVCVILVGGKTNNPHASLGYPHIEVLFEPVTASTWMVDKIMNVQLGSKAGDAFAGLSILMPMLVSHEGGHKPSWSYDISILTDGESTLYEDDVDIVADKLANHEANHNNPVRIQIAGFGFKDRPWNKAGRFLETDKSETKLKSEALYRRFKQARPSSSPTIIGNIYRAVTAARAPQLKEVKPTSRAMSIRIGDSSVNEREAIEIHVKVGKLTSMVTPQSTKKVAVKMDGERGSTQASGSRARGDAGGGRRVVGPDGEDLGQIGGSQFQSQYASTSNTNYPSNSQSSQTQDPSSSYAAPDPNFNYPKSSAEYYKAKSADYRINNLPYYLDRNQPEVISNALKPVTTYNVRVGGTEEGEGGEIQAVEKEKLTKAWRFGNSWFPVDDDDGLAQEKFETTAGLDLYKFILASEFDREFEMGEVRYAWPSPDSAKSQIQLSSLVQAMLGHADGEYYAIFRYCYSNNSSPHLCVAKGAVHYQGQHYLQFVQLPFADDYRRFYFSPLENVVNSKRQLVTTHSTIPTDAQREAISNLVDTMDVSEQGEVDDDGMPQPFFQPTESFNPAVHRIKDAMYHQFTARVGEPLFPMHSDLVKYFDAPEKIRDEIKEAGLKAKEVLEVKKLPPKISKKRAAELGEEEDLAGLDELLAAAPTSRSSSTSQSPPKKSETPTNAFASSSKQLSNGSSPLSKKTGASSSKKSRTTNPGESDPDVTMGQEDDVKQEEDDSETEDEEDEALLRDPVGNYEKSLSYHNGSDNSEAANKTFQEAISKLITRGEHREALKCLRVLRSKSIEIEETLNFNSFITKLKKTVRSSSANKTKSFWPFFVKEGGRRLGLITAQEDKYNESIIEDEEADAFVA
ncbi:hypothetical protein BDY24DRAFT_385475 [Mrakia frigida]|uniref:uncharacterized protein n=1 Tax=Mrakia frigida TaxID=29902 RepID=UPI003FCC25C9